MDAVINTFQPDQRDSFGQYVILPGHIHVFPFTIPLFGKVCLELTHILPNSQDFSIDAWISEEPLDELVLRDGIGHFRLIRRQTVFHIHDETLRQGDHDSRLFLKSGIPYYVNVKDLQNRKNAYELFIEEVAHHSPPVT